MSFTAKLIFEDREINILNFSYTFRQNVDYNGKPSAKPRLAGLSMIIESTKDNDLLSWMYDPLLRKQLKIHIEPRSLNGKGRTIEFIDACCVEYLEKFNDNDTKPMTIS